MQVLSRLRRQRTSSTAFAGLIDQAPVVAAPRCRPLIVMGAVLIPFRLWAFGRAELYAKRTGKLKRVG